MDLTLFHPPNPEGLPRDFKMKDRLNGWTKLRSCRFLEWTEAGVFERAWVKALGDYEEFVGIDWTWLAMDGAMTKAPLGGKKNGAEPHRPGQRGNQAQLAHRRERCAPGRRRRRGEPQRLQAGA